MNLPKQVRIVEVGPRDGLQNEPGAMLSADLKANLINRLATSGLQHIEAAAFVHPKWVPQMANSTEVLQRITRHQHVNYSALTPNMQGLRRALEAGIDEIAVFGAASESFSQRNTNCSIDEGLSRFAPVIKTAQAEGLKVRGYVSVVVDCPYEGPVDPQKVAQVSDALMQMGCYEISLGDNWHSYTWKNARHAQRRHALCASQKSCWSLPRYLRPSLGQCLCHATSGCHLF